MSLKSIIDIIEICERQGFAFQVSGNENIETANPRVTFFTTGNKPVIMYSRKLSFDGDGVNADMYRDATFSGGDVIESFSVNDLIQNTAQSVVTSNATTIDTGVKTRATVYVFGNTSNQGQGAALQSIDAPQIIPPNSTVRLVLTGRSGSQSVASHLSWCEPAHIEGLSVSTGSWVYVGEALQV